MLEPGKLMTITKRKPTPITIRKKLLNKGINSPLMWG